MLQVLKEIIGHGLPRGEIQVVNGAKNSRLLEPDKNCVLQGNGEENISSHLQNGEHYEDIKLVEALVSLCAAIWDKWFKADTDLARQFDKITADICSEEGEPPKSFISLVKEAQELLRKRGMIFQGNPN